MRLCRHRGVTAGSFGGEPISMGLALFACRKLANDRCGNCMTPSGLGEIGLLFRDKGLGAGKCVFHCGGRCLPRLCPPSILCRSADTFRKPWPLR
jgi:hypothetical protein